MCPLLSVRFYSIILYSVFNEHFLLGIAPLEVVGSSGLEPPTSRLSGARSNHLSYEPIKLNPVYLFTLAFLPIRSLHLQVLSLRFLFPPCDIGCQLCWLVEMMGFEPMTPCLQGRCSPN